MGKTVFATGTVEPAQEQKIYAVTTSRVVELTVKPGDRVKAGQVMGRLENESLLGELKAAEADLVQKESNLEQLTSPALGEVDVAKAALKEAEVLCVEARENFQRVKILFAQGAASAAELEAAQSKMAQAEANYTRAAWEYKKITDPNSSEVEKLRALVEQAEAAYDLARKRYGQSFFIAEIDGVILKAETKEGEMVKAGEPLITIGKIDELKVHSKVSEVDAAILECGQEVKVTCAALPEKVFKGRVSHVAPVAQTAQGQQGMQTTVEVVIEVDNTSGKLLPGYTADLEIETISPYKTLVVPYEAVVERDGRKIVFVVGEDERVRLRDISTGISNELYIEITGGVSKGDVIVVNPPEKLEDGKLVNVTNGKISEERP